MANTLHKAGTGNLSKLITDFEIVPQKAVFIDDLMDNIAEARALGFHAVHFTSKKNAVRQLLDFGVK